MFHSRAIACMFAPIASMFLFLCSCSRSDKIEARAEPISPVSVAVAKATREHLSNELVLSAEFKPYQEVDVHAKVAGYVRHIYVDIGDRVIKDQLLANLEIPELTNDLEQAAAGEKRSEAELMRMRDELRRAESAHEATHLSYARLSSVIKVRPNLVAQQEVDEAMARDRVSEAQVSAGRSALASAEQQVQVSKASERKVHTLIGYSRITAPIAGVVTKRFVDTGEMVQAGTASFTQANPVVRLCEVDRLRLVLPLPESVVGRVKVGTPVAIRAHSLNRAFQGTVTRFTGQVERTTRTMETEVDVPNGGLVLKPGMYAEAVITFDHRNNALTVPVQAVSGQQGNQSVYVVTPEKKIEERSVRLGLETATKVEILSGLRENDPVVVGNRSQLKPGQRVEPKLVEPVPEGQR